MAAATRQELERLASRAGGRPAIPRVSLVAGAAANTNIAIAGIKRSDLLLAVIELPASAAATDRSSTASITSDGNIQSTAVTTGNQLLVHWLQT
jgi:hypothetical protein